MSICVVGGGLNGAAAALALAEAGWSVSLVDRKKPSPSPAALGVEIRNVALSPASRDFLEGLHAWQAGAPYTRMHIWEALGTAVLDFDAETLEHEALGWIVEVGALNERLWACLEAHQRITVHLGSVDALTPGAEQVCLDVSGQPVEAQLVVAADGGASRVRELTGTGVKRMPTGHSALATAVRFAEPHGGVAFQRFLSNGPLALLPSRDAHVCSVVWSQPPEEAERRRDLTEDAFLREVSSASEHVLGTALETDVRFVFPLVQQLAERFDAAPRVVLIGDAARVVHPLAGLGVNLGFEDTTALLKALRPGDDPGAADLRTYSRRRRVRSRAVIELMSALRGSYGNSAPWFGWARNAGVRAIAGSEVLKAQIMREAMGLGPMATAMR